MTRRFDVLLAGYYGFGNLGDELLADSAVSLLQKNGIERERIAILSADPVGTYKQKDIFAFDRWRLAEVIKVMRNSRTLLLGGGGLFQDMTSVRSCFYYWGLVSSARLCGAVPWAVGQSIGPLRSPLAKKLAKNAMAACVCRGVRDERSLGQLKSWGLGGELSADLVMGLDIKKAQGLNNLLLLNLRPGYDGLAERMARAAQTAAEEKHASIRCVAFSEEDRGILRRFIDNGVIKSIESQEILLAKSIGDFENAAMDCSCALGMRLHFVILSFLSGLRVIAAAYDPKVKSLALRYNIPVIDENCGEIRFSEPRCAGGANGEAGRLACLFSGGLAAALREA